ncbi:MAG: hypothetical protein NW241_22530 [Bacteroidia bacterium]|nr:hypothetical protein [Bacteroidia bacterium]
MWDTLLQALGSRMFWAYASIPAVSAVVGWFTNVVALRMTFYPLEFQGIRPWLGWQGIIPSKAGVMAGKAVDLLTQRLITIEDRFEQIEPERVAEEMEPALNRLSRQIISETLENQAPLVWENLPSAVRQRIFQRVEEDVPVVVAHIMEEIKSNITDLFDLRTMVVEALENNKELLNQIFLRVGAKEFRFIELSGLYFGLIFGIPQVLIVWGMDRMGWGSGWTLPVAGLIVGWATNALALKMIFEPLRPRRFGPAEFQGLFIKRQMEVSAEYAAIVASRILTSRNIFERLISGPASDRISVMIQTHVKQAVDNVAGFSKPIFQLTQGASAFVTIRNTIARRFVEELPHSIRHIFAYAEQALDIEHTLCARMQSLPPEQFVGFLRPVFQEDEWKLILVGAVLGLAAGFVQWAFVFGM